MVEGAVDVDARGNNVTVVEDSGVRYMVPPAADVKVVEQASTGPLRVKMTLPGERRIVAVKNYRVARASRVVHVRRPERVVVERSFIEP